MYVVQVSLKYEKSKISGIISVLVINIYTIVNILGNNKYKKSFAYS